MKFVGGSLCLDFVNTVDAWVSTLGGTHLRPYGDTELREKLVDYEALVRWSQLAAAISVEDVGHLLELSASHEIAAVATLNRAHRLRRALYRILKSVLQRWEPESVDVDLLLRELATARKHEQLEHCNGVFHWMWDKPSGALDSVLWPVARSAVELLTSADLSRLRQCKGDECGWMFLDTSRNRRRHWCDMSDCGNRDKVRRFRGRTSTC